MRAFALSQWQVVDLDKIASIVCYSTNCIGIVFLGTPENTYNFNSKGECEAAYKKITMEWQNKPPQEGPMR